MERIETAGRLNAYQSSHFAPAFFFMSGPRREALKVLYKVCRVLDDAVDLNQGDPQALLNGWRQFLISKNPDDVAQFGHRGLAEKFVKVAENYGVPYYAISDLIDKGVAEDLVKNRFQTPMDLERYCYGVAGT